jgi:uncharacterized membrane protein
MSRWKPAFALLLVFIAGMVVGVVGTRIIVRRVAADMLQHPETARNMVQRAMELRLARRLHLEPQQRNRVREILAEMQGQLKLINQETQPRRAEAITNAEAQINLVLNPDQKAEFEKLKEEYPALLQPNQFQFQQQQQQQQLRQQNQQNQ